MTAVVDVVIPTTRNSDLLLRALKSVAAQSQPVERVIVVDNSPGGVLPQVQVEGLTAEWIHEPVRGAAAARNAGVRHSSADYVAFLDDDDLWFPNHIEHFRSRVGERKDVFFAAQVEIYFDVEGKVAQTTMPTILESMDPAVASSRGNVATSGVVAPRDALLSFPAEVSLLRSQDRDQWAQLLLNGWGIVGGRTPTARFHRAVSGRFKIVTGLKTDALLIKRIRRAGYDRRSAAAIYIHLTRSTLYAWWVSIFPHRWDHRRLTTAKERSR